MKSIDAMNRPGVLCDAAGAAFLGELEHAFAKAQGWRKEMVAWRRMEQVMVFNRLLPAAAGG